MPKDLGFSIQLFDALRVLPQCRNNMLKRVYCIIHNIKRIAIPLNYRFDLQQLAKDSAYTSKVVPRSLELYDWYEGDLEYVMINRLDNSFNSCITSVPCVSNNSEPMLCIGKLQFPMSKKDNILKYSRLKLYGNLHLNTVENVDVLQLHRWKKISNNSRDDFVVQKPLVRSTGEENAIIKSLLQKDRECKGQLIYKQYCKRQMGVSGLKETQVGTYRDFKHIDCRVLIVSPQLIVNETDVSEVSEKTFDTGKLYTYVTQLKGIEGTCEGVRNSYAWDKDNENLLKIVSKKFEIYEKYRIDTLSTAEIRKKIKEQNNYIESNNLKLNIDMHNAAYDTVQIAMENPYALVFIQNIRVEEADYLYEHNIGSLSDMTELFLIERRKACLHISLSNYAKSEEDLKKEVYFSLEASKHLLKSKFSLSKNECYRTLNQDVSAYAMKVNDTESKVAYYVDSYGLYLLQNILRTLREHKNRVNISKETYKELIDCYQSFIEHNEVLLNLYEAFLEYPVYIKAKVEDSLVLEGFLKYMQIRLSNYGIHLAICDISKVSYQGVNSLKKLLQFIRENKNNSLLFYGDTTDSMLLKILQQSINIHIFDNTINHTVLMENYIKYITKRTKDIDLPLIEKSTIDDISEEVKYIRMEILNIYDEEPDVCFMGSEKLLLEGIQKNMQVSTGLTAMRNLSSIAFTYRKRRFYESECVVLNKDIGSLKTGEKVFICSIEIADRKAYVTLEGADKEEILSLPLTASMECSTECPFDYAYLRSYESDFKGSELSGYKKNVILICETGSCFNNILPLLCSGRNVQLIGKKALIQRVSRSRHTSFEPLSLLF